MTEIGKVKIHRNVTQRKYTTITNACPVVEQKFYWTSIFFLQSVSFPI